ncbi:MAG: site-specific integrase [Gammaproteobacteria bacterium]|nr:site-specific integrase [Gammaproteobacteria bacterium]
MSVYQRKGSEVWQIEFYFNGERIRQSSKTKDKQEAEQKEAELKRQLWRQENLGDKPKQTWKESVVRYIKEKQHKKSIDSDITGFRTLAPYFEHFMIQELTRLNIDEALDSLQDEREISNARVNRLASFIRTMLNMACDEWEWIDKAPKIRMRTESQNRIRWITQAEAYRLISVAPKHWKNVIKLTLATGLRKTNIMTLKWSQIDMQRHCAWIHADEAKGKRNIAVPLNEDALAVLKQQIGLHDEYVFTYAGKPFRFDYTSWHEVIAKAGIKDFRFHDLRHTWASWHVQAGTSLQELMELGGWRHMDMVLRYAHLSSESLKDASNRIVFKNNFDNVIAING